MQHHAVLGQRLPAGRKSRQHPLSDQGFGRVHALVSISKLQHICPQAQKDPADNRAQARETKDTPRMLEASTIALY